MAGVPGESSSRRVVGCLGAAGLSRAESGLWLDSELEVGALEHEGHVVVGPLLLRWPRPEPPPEYVLVDPVHLVPPVDDDVLMEAVSEARRRGRARRRECRYCGRNLNPGLMHSLDMCMSCVEWRLRPRVRPA